MHSLPLKNNLSLSSVDLNAADTGVQLKSSNVPQDRKQTQQQKQDGCNC